MNWLAKAVDGISAESGLRQGIMTLGELRTALQMLPPETPVLVNGQPPASLASYRGYYERLAIGTTRHRDDYRTELHTFGSYGGYVSGASEVTIAEPVTTAELVKALDIADGEEFEGYKGGQFTMHAGTFMHVAEYGDTGLAVFGVTIADGAARISAGEYEW